MLIFLIRKKTKYVYSSIIFLIVFSNGVFSNTLWRLLEYPWERLDYSLVDSSDGIVVLIGGGIKLPPINKKIIEWNDPDRFYAGLEIFKSGKAKTIIFTGAKSAFKKK